MSWATGRCCPPVTRTPHLLSPARVTRGAPSSGHQRMPPPPPRCPSRAGLGHLGGCVGRTTLHAPLAWDRPSATPMRATLAVVGHPCPPAIAPSAAGAASGPRPLAPARCPPPRAGSAPPAARPVAEAAWWPLLRPGSAPPSPGVGGVLGPQGRGAASTRFRRGGWPPTTSAPRRSPPPSCGTTPRGWGGCHRPTQSGNFIRRGRVSWFCWCCPVVVGYTQGCRDAQP